MKNLVFILAAAGLLFGCSSAGNNFDSRKLSQVKKGETDEPQLIALFGQPQQRGIDSEKGVNLQWIYVETTIKGGSFIPLVGAFAGGVKEKTKTLTVFMNQSGKVSSYDYSGGGFESSNGIQNDPESATNQTFVLKTPKQR